VPTVPGNLVERRWVATLLAACAVVLVPWALVLAYRLPARHTSEHWDVAWVGFDIALAGALAATGWAISARSAWAPSAAAVAATLLLCDAWFDNVLANGTGEHLEAAAEALVVEVPLAILCVWLARDSERTVTRVLATIEGGRRGGAGGRRPRSAGVDVPSRGDGVLQPVDGRQRQRREDEPARRRPSDGRDPGRGSR
jgi:hypothetical protein